ncbi:uroporphyrinogen-III synthase [Candidatus Puniceispirillum sp.]|nr:uroporphyrinogen-III synthase [Candidatus Puniceispirillum sp.]
MPKMILIIRPQPDANRDVALLKRYGVPALASPSMKGMQLHYKLPKPTDFSGIIMTSRNAVDTIATSRHTAAWAKMPIFVVGAASAAAARNAGFLDIIIGAGGGAGLLPSIRRYISDRKGTQDIDNLPLFWPSAVEISFDMVAALAAHEIAVQRLPVYQMIANDELDAVTTDKIGKGAIAAVVAMSSRSIRIFQKNLDAAGKGSSRGRMALIAGSAAIAAAAGDGWQMVYVARQPRRSRLLAIAILRYQRGH